MKPAIFIVAFCFFSITSSAQSGSVPCAKFPFIKENFSPQKPFYHIYSVPDYELVDLNEYANASREFVYQCLISNAASVAPVLQHTAVSDCGIITITGLGSILTKLDPKSFSVTNYTLPDHRLASGKVTRRIVQVGHKIFIRTSGVGNNQNEFWHLINQSQFAADLVWGLPNLSLYETVQAQLKLKDDRRQILSTSVAFFKWYKQVWELQLPKISFVLNKKGLPYADGECPCRIDMLKANNVLRLMMESTTVLGSNFGERIRMKLNDAGSKLKAARSDAEADGIITDLYINGFNVITTQDIPEFEKSGFYDPAFNWQVLFLSNTDAMVNTPDFFWDGKRSRFTFHLNKQESGWKLSSGISLLP